MPSHMADEKNAQKRDAYIAAGILSWPLIRGNDCADELAARGARRHPIPPEDILFAEDDALITGLQRNHLMASTMHWHLSQPEATTPL